MRHAERVTTARTRREAAALLRRLLAALEAGELAAEDGQGAAVVRLGREVPTPWEDRAGRQPNP